MPRATKQSVGETMAQKAEKPRQRAERGSTPERFNLPVAEGWTGQGGRLEAAAKVAGKASASDWARDELAAAMKRLGVG